MQMLMNYSRSVPFSRCTPQTQHFLNSRTIELLPKGAIVVNAARSSLVDDEAVIAALKTGRIAAAGLDVYESEPNIHPAYRSLPNTFLLPHLGTAKAAPKTEKNDIVRAPFIVVLPAKTPIEGCGSPHCRPTLSPQFCDNVKSVCWPQSSRKNLAGIERCIKLRSGLFVQDTQCRHRSERLLRMKEILQPADGQRRVVIERVLPEIDCGRFPIKRVVGEAVVVEADVFADGHDQVTCQVLYSRGGNKEWQSSPMTPLGNDRWRGAFSVPKAGRYEYTIEGWIDRFQTWRDALAKRISAGQDVHVDLLIGTELIEAAAARATGEDAGRLRQWARRICEEKDLETATSLALEEELFRAVRCYPERQSATRCEKPLAVVVDREKARFSAIMLAQGWTARDLPGLRGLASLISPPWVLT